MRSVISTKEERKTMARRLGLVYSCTASINMVSVLREPAEPPNSRMSACESSAAFCAAVAGIQRYLASASERVTLRGVPSTNHGVVLFHSTKHGYLIPF